MVIVVAVMPGADAVRAALELEPEPVLEPELELELELHAATASAAVAMTAIAGTRSRCDFDLFIECLLSHGVWPASRRPKAWHPRWMPHARDGQRRSREGGAATALRPGFPAGR